MEYQDLCDILGISVTDDLVDGFKSLFYLHPDSSCPSIQLVNFLLPLVMECLRVGYSEDVSLIQCNQYLYVQVFSSYFLFF